MKRKFNIGDIVTLKTGNVEILDYIEPAIYKYKCQNCGSIDTKNVSNFHRTGCRICSNQRVVRGINDMWTTAPDIAKLLANKEDGYLYTKSSSKKVDWICPFCKKIIKDISIRQVTSQKLSCPFCSDGISYPNRIMIHILSELNVEFIREFSPKWVKNYRYDFYIPNSNIIIEMDGGYGHGYRGTKEHRQFDRMIDNIKDDLASEQKLKVIRIDCNYPSLQQRGYYIVNNILNSQLISFLDLVNLNFEKIIEICDKDNHILMASKMYENGKDIQTIANEMQVHPVTISRYLMKGNILKLCEYTPRKRKNINYSFNTKKVEIINEFGKSKIVQSVSDAAKQTNVHRSSVSRCLNGKINSCKGYVYKYCN